MEIRGVAVQSIQAYAESMNPEKYNEWLNSLSEKSRDIMTGRIVDGAWYNMHDAATEPTKKICDLFFNSSDRGAWEAGNFSAEHGLKGVYSFFVKIMSPEFLINRAASIMNTYYRPCEIKAAETGKGKAYLHIVKFDEPNHMIELRIGGWVERALELCGCNNTKVKITKSLVNGDDLTEFKANWD